MIDVVRIEFFVMNTMNTIEGFPERHAPSLDKIATEFYGMKYVGQQTDGCLGAGNYLFNFDNESEVEQWGQDFDERYPDWVAAHSEGSEYDFVIYRKAPGIGEVLADLIRKEQLPRGRYLIRIDW
jgi:hypothetical protein